MCLSRNHSVIFEVRLSPRAPLHFLIIINRDDNNQNDDCNVMTITFKYSHDLWFFMILHHLPLPFLSPFSRTEFPPETSSCHDASVSKLLSLITTLIIIIMVIILVITITYDSVWWFLLPLKKTVTWDSFQKQFLTDLTTIIMNLLVEITSARELFTEVKQKFHNCD